jgi:hypothetical protein
MFCKTCVADQVKEILGDAHGKFAMKCIVCRDPVDRRSVEQLGATIHLEPEVIKRWSKFTYEATIPRDLQTYCPFIGDESGDEKCSGNPENGSFMNSKADAAFVGQMDCIYCDRSFCVHHDMPWHEGKTCEEYDRAVEAKQEEGESNAFIEQTTTKCPNCPWRVTHPRGHACHHIRPGGGCPNW